MKKLLPVLAAIATALVLAPSESQAGLSIIREIDISPMGGALNLGSTVYVRDHTVGLTALNAVGQPASAATGGEIGPGIRYDEATNILTVNVGYGSDFGFVNLAGNYSNAHIHGAIPVQFPSPNIGAGIAIGAPFAGLHAAGSSAMTGSFTGTVSLSAAQEVDLFDNELYINIHSSFAGGGEIRGQLVVVPEPNAAILVGLAGSLLFPFRRRRN